MNESVVNKGSAESLCYNALELCKKNEFIHLCTSHSRPPFVSHTCSRFEKEKRARYLGTGARSYMLDS